MSFNTMGSRHLTTTAGMLAGALALAATSCSVNPVTGSRELMLMSESQEIQLGTAADDQIIAQYGVIEDAALTAYVAAAGARLVTVSHRPDLRFTFRVLDDSVVNAFALPGGYVYLTRGILSYLNSEAAMAGVLGHEVGHVTARHGARRYTQQQLVGLGLGIGSAVSEDFAKVAGIAAGGAQLLLLKFGRDDERQSDRLGVEYGTKIGYDTRDMANFFRTLDQLSGGSRLPDWQSTHPDPGERYETVKALTTEWQAQVGRTDFTWGRDEFLKRLDGLPFGPNPREGFVESNVFKHPGLRFRFPVPDAWRVLNGKAQVQVVEPNGAAAVLFSIATGAAGSGTTSADAAADAFAATETVTELSRSRLMIGGFRAVRLVSTAASRDGPLAVESTFIEMDAAVFVFHALTANANVATFGDRMRASADGFRRLTETAALDVKPVRIAIIAAPRHGTLGDLLGDHPIPERAGVTAEDLARMNQMSLAERVPKGTLFKVLR